MNKEKIAEVQKKLESLGLAELVMSALLMDIDNYNTATEFAKDVPIIIMASIGALISGGYLEFTGKSARDDKPKGNDKQIEFEFMRKPNLN